MTTVQPGTIVTVVPINCERRQRIHVDNTWAEHDLLLGTRLDRYGIPSRGTSMARISAIETIHQTA